jgi:hypothetical protein
VQREGEDVVGVPYVHLVLHAVHGVNAGGEHGVDGVEPAEVPGLRPVFVEVDGQGEGLASVDEPGSFDDPLGCGVVERAGLVVFAPAVPVAELLA